MDLGSVPHLFPVGESSGLLPEGFRGRFREDNVQVEIRLADGSRAEIFYLASGDSSLPKERLEVFGEGWTAVVEDFVRSSFYCEGHCRSRRLLLQDKGHREALGAFVRAARHHQNSPLSFESLYATSLATFRLRESLLRGKALSVFEREES